jgi:hypothetical protein
LNDLKNIWWIIISVFVYFSFFEYLKKHSLFVFSEEHKESRYFSFVFSLYGFYNFIVLLFILLPYLFFIKKAYFEIFILLLLYILTKILFLQLLKSYVNIIHNYSLLESMQPKKVKNLLQNIINLAKLDLKNLVYSKSKLSLEKYKKYITPFMSSIVLFIMHKTSLFQSTIFTLTILSLVLSSLLNFNLLSSFYIILTLIIWFWIISIISVGFPRKKIEIELVTKEKIRNVFLIEDNPKGYYLVLTKRNQIIKIMKNSVVKIK